MLDFIDQPLPHLPPVRDRLVARLVRRANQLWRLPHVLQIGQVRLQGSPALKQIGPKDRLVLLANHPSHADAAILMDACRKIGLRARFLAAREVFLRGRIDRFILQRTGCIPIDREAASTQSLNWAMDALCGKEARPRWPLCVFPEGNVWLQQDHPAPFAQGAALIALRAQKKMDEGRIWAVPVAIRLTHDKPLHAQQAHEKRLGELEALLDLPAHTGKPLANATERLAAVGREALKRNLSHRGFDVPEFDSPSAAAPQAAQLLADDLAGKMAIAPQADWQATLAACRQGIHTCLSDPERAADHAAAEAWADQAMLALRLGSYLPGYLLEAPNSLERIGETIEKLWEDLNRKMPPPLSPRTAHVRFGEPVDIAALQAEHPKLRQATAALTTQMQDAVQAMLDGLRKD